MRIGIVTVYKSYNYGSLLQATALRNILSKYGEVYFLDIGQRKTLIPFLFRIRKTIKDNKKNGNIPKYLLFEIKEY